TAASPSVIMAPSWGKSPMDRRGSRLSRRQFVLGAGGLGLVAGCGRWPWPGQQVRGEQPARIPRIGYLAGVRPEPIEGIRQGLHDLGYVEGKNVAFEIRQNVEFERLPDLAAELAGLPVDVIVVSGAIIARAVRNATST